MPQGVYNQPIYIKLPQETRDEIEKFAKKYGVWSAAVKFKTKAGMTENALYRALRVKVEHVPRHGSRGYQGKKAKKLTDEEKQFLVDLSSGKKEVEDIARFVAVRVFEKMLKYPDDFKFYDFYQAQMLKLKKEEQATKNTVAMELITRLFNGQLPPTHCPNCGHEIIKINQIVAIEEAKVIEEK